MCLRRGRLCTRRSPDAVAFWVAGSYRVVGDVERAFEWSKRLKSEKHRERLRAFFLYALGRFEEASEAGRKAIELQPDDPGVYGILLLTLSVGLGEYEEAEQVAREAFSLLGGND